MRAKAIAIVPSAGVGRRFDPFIKKTFADLNGLPLLIQTLKRLNQSRCIGEIIPVMRPEDIEEGYEMAISHGLEKVKRIVPGGRERQDSVYNGLRSIEADAPVLIHDGVRPIIPDGLIERLMDELDGYDGVVPGVPLRETIKMVDKGVVVRTVSREGLWSIQTPQLFHIEALRRAYQSAYSDGYYATDDSALVERIGGRVKIIMGSLFNIKVTTPEDLEMVRYLLSSRKEAR
jgi:2-C-methyl-D-erythritol 4-phosphate cytidylyltransferase